MSGPPPSSAAAAAESKSPAAESHPPGLYALFGAEAWERFSYYGMRALLTLYLIKHLNYERSEALGIYAVYTGLVYFTPFIGGLLADKLLGRRKAVLIGGALMVLGHLAMAVESLLFPALGLLIAGNGFFKPNISTIVGGLYREGDPRRDGGFTIFYMGINLGAFLSPQVCGRLGESIGWHYGFSAAAFGMVAGLLVFVWGQKFLARIGLPPKREARPAAEDAQGDRLVARDYFEVALWVSGATALVFGVLALWVVVGPLWQATGSVGPGLLVTLVLGTIAVLLFKGANGEETERLLVVVILCAFNVFFWLGFEQAGGTMTLFADTQTDRALGVPAVGLIMLVLVGGGFNVWWSNRHDHAGRPLWIGIAVFLAVLVPTFYLWTWLPALLKDGSVGVVASEFQAINPLLIVAMAPTMSKLWLRLDQGRFRTSTPTKMAIGLSFLGLGFVVLYAGQQLAERTGPISPAWLAAVYFLHTTGELCLSPIGLSMVTKLAPARVNSLAMGVWLFSSAVANYLAGKAESIVHDYHLPLYGVLIATSFGAAVLLLLLTPLLKRWMHGRA